MDLERKVWNEYIYSESLDSPNAARVWRLSESRPELFRQSSYPCDCYEGCRGVTDALYNVIMHLNDEHTEFDTAVGTTDELWSRDRIANWLDEVV